MHLGQRMEMQRVRGRFPLHCHHTKKKRNKRWEKL
jgi:hypothetical protein